jgi:hypothetical protein
MYTPIAQAKPASSFILLPSSFALGIDIARIWSMAASMHSYRKEQREAVNGLVRKVLVADMASFNPERFRDWTKNLDYQFRKTGLTLRFEIRQGTVYFTVKDVRTGRRAYDFHTSTRVIFDDRDVVPAEEKVIKL